MLSAVICRTGFEEDKDFPVVINAVVAGRYHVTEYLDSAAFSKAIQAHDLHTGMDVCMEIIKNNKDFFDQSLDEIKLLKYINKHDPGDKHHLLRLYDYFYHWVMTMTFVFFCFRGQLWNVLSVWPVTFCRLPCGCFNIGRTIVEEERPGSYSPLVFGTSPHLFLAFCVVPLYSTHSLGGTFLKCKTV